VKDALLVVLEHPLASGLLWGITCLTIWKTVTDWKRIKP
jgi:hypothetical protein